MNDTQQVIDHNKIGKKGFPRHYQAFNLEPPMKTVPVIDDQPQTGHTGLTVEELVMIERDRRINGGFEFQGIRYQSRQQDMDNIAGASLAALAAITAGAQAGDYRWHGGDTDFAWIADDNSLVPMDAQTMFAFGQAAMAHKQALIFAARALKDLPEIPVDFMDDKRWVE